MNEQYPELDVTKVSKRYSQSKTVRRAVRWQCRADDFRRLPPVVRGLLGGRITQAFLDVVADQTLEEYLNEAMQWH